MLSTLANDLREMPQAKATLLAAGIISVLVLAAYSNSFKVPFQFDDFHQIANNQNIRDLSNVPRFFVDAGLGSYDTTLKGYRPATHASFAINYALSGDRVFGFHAFNLALHIVNAFLIFIIVGAVLREAGREEPWATALTASLIFALHPIQTSGVTYISGRAGLLASFFYMLAFYAFLRYRSGTGGRACVWAALSPLCYLMGLMSKEMAVSLPLLMLAYDLIFTMPKRGGIWNMLRPGLYYLPFAAALAAYLALRRSLSGFYTSDVPPFGTASYLMSEAKAFLLYVRLLILPINQNADYDLPATMYVDFRVVAASLIIAAILYCLYRLRSKDPAALFFGCWFFIALAPESSLVPIPDIAVEYRLYLPSVGFIAAAVMLTDGLLKGREILKKAIVFPLIAMLLVLTFSRNRVWATESALWSDAAGKSPHSARAHGNLGNALYHEKRYAEAVGEFMVALKTPYDDPRRSVMYNDLGLCYYETGRVNEALSEFRRAVETNPKFVEPYGNMGAIYYDTGRYAEAEEILKEAVAVDPKFTLAHFNLGLVYGKLFRYAEAVGEMEQAAMYSPMDFEVRYNLAVAYNGAGQPYNALIEAGEALGLASDEGQRDKAGSLLAMLKKAGG